MQGLVNKIFDRGGAQSTSSYNTPDKKMRLTEIIYGSSNDRSGMGSRAIPYDFFSHDIPDPSMAHSKTRETITI